MNAPSREGAMAERNFSQKSTCFCVLSKDYFLNLRLWVYMQKALKKTQSYGHIKAFFLFFPKKAQKRKYKLQKPMNKPTLLGIGSNYFLFTPNSQYNP